MPISNIHKDRSIVPDALAFPYRAATGVNAATTFQSQQQQVVNNYYTSAGADAAYVQKELQRSQVAMRDAEGRSKAWVSEYERAFEWSIANDNVQIQTNGTTLIPFVQENIRALGCQNYQIPGAGALGKYWRYIVPPGAEGIYWVYCHLSMNFTQADGIIDCFMLAAINGVPYRVLDATSHRLAPPPHVRDAILGGGCHIPLAVGDELNIMTRTVGTPFGADILYPPTSIYGYVTGHRTRCDMGGAYNEDNGAPFGVTADGLSYQFYHGA